MTSNHNAELLLPPLPPTTLSKMSDTVSLRKQLKVKAGVVRRWGFRLSRLITTLNRDQIE